MSVLGLVALGLAAVFALVVLIAFPAVRAAISQMLTGTFILFLGGTLVALLVIAITGINLDPFIRQAAVALTRHRLVDFYTLLPDQDRVQNVQYVETDGDGDKEWVVFYQFDLIDGRSPYAGVVYDYDRGEPPVLFPYRLLPPDRDYLSEGIVRLDLEDIVTLGETQPVKEMLIYGQAGGLDIDLTIFRYVPNSLPWEFPRDEPRAYQVIGNFRGDGGVSFNLKTKRVTVRNRAGYDRSQLAVETVYGLDEARGTYMSLANSEQLGAPVSSKVVFAFGMPPDILDTPYPEKLVLGFYQMLAEKQPTIEPSEFLTGEALIQYNQDNLAYFGFGNVTGNVNQVSITRLNYAPEVEQINPSITVLGEEPRFLIVSVDFEAQVGASFTQTTQPIQWVTTLVNGKWRIDRRL